MPMSGSARPSPFSPTGPFKVMVLGGTPPYIYTPKGSPPNPPGVQVAPDGPTADVSVPPETPPGQIVQVDVSDSSTPPQTITVTNTTS
jgi:hypothetical protein